MKIWTNNDFEGHWPVGTAAVVVAKTAEDAKTYLDMFLSEKSLPESSVDQFKPMPFEDGQVSILCDGNY
jgi:hypothetical protein